MPVVLDSFSRDFNLFSRGSGRALTRFWTFPRAFGLFSRESKPKTHGKGLLSRKDKSKTRVSRPELEMFVLNTFVQAPATETISIIELHECL